MKPALITTGLIIALGVTGDGYGVILIQSIGALLMFAGIKRG